MWRTTAFETVGRSPALARDPRLARNARTSRNMRKGAARAAPSTEPYGWTSLLRSPFRRHAKSAVADFVTLSGVAARN
jgi:hypothetical protein